MDDRIVFLTDLGEVDNVQIDSECGNFIDWPYYES